VATFRGAYRPFLEARDFARNLQLETSREWTALCRGKLLGRPPLPPDIPRRPDGAYRNDGWQGWCDRLGARRLHWADRRRRPFAEAREFARGLRLKSAKEWRRYVQGRLPEKGEKPADIPYDPARAYKRKGWVNWGDWLGTDNTAPWLRRHRAFEDAREFARSLNLRSRREWRAFCTGKLPDLSRPCDIPTTPDQVYRDKGWDGFRDWLGTEDAQGRSRG